MTDEPPRGAHILDAAVRLIAADGLAGLSIRAVAAEAGVSVAQVQYYFGSKDALIEAAFDRAGAEFLSLLEPVFRRPPSPRRLRELIMLWLPLDEQREHRVKVWLAFAGAAASHPALAESSRQNDREVAHWFEQELAGLGVADPAVQAAHLLALIDGLALRCLTLPPRTRATLIKQVLDSHLAVLVPGTMHT
ncbi:TetR/AcrR family transcriptional regulator [Microlunatus parietis]|uniref:AcrR family transcriptional regulator n=1 Tax=Microlunatus parietis TaxID=682979 RepID=A0A7Y9IBV2_9ACTN|nr:TetR/AcrR family transcriptional regulator [Microlunatus parietis]NYE73429.1 AcrR family transcriptional regulator [Microlunatus parietis]